MQTLDHEATEVDPEAVAVTSTHPPAIHMPASSDKEKEDLKNLNAEVYILKEECNKLEEGSMERLLKRIVTLVLPVFH